MSKYGKKSMTLSEVCGNIASGITGVFVFIILVIFPIYTHNMYFDILGARYVFFKLWAIILASLLFAMGTIYFIIDYKNQVSSPTAFARFINELKPKNIKKHIVITDIFMLTFLIVAIISTIATKFKEEAFYGNSGRYQGLECWIMYFISYICITRTFKFKKFYLDFTLIAGCFACIWATLDFLMLDPFGFFVNVGGIQRYMFTSTVGNLNTFTNYSAMLFAIAVSLFAIEKNMIRTILYAIASIICAVGSMAGISDNIILSFFIIYLLLPFFMLKTRRGFIRYLIIIDFSLISLFVLHLLCLRPHNSAQISVCMQLASNNLIAFLFIPFTIVIAVITYAYIKFKPNYDNTNIGVMNPLDSKLPKIILYIYTGIIIVFFVFMIYMLYDINVAKKHIDIWSKLPGYNEFVFSDDWGTHRGHNWRIAITNFLNFDLFKKLFGYGPDTYLVVSERTFYQEMVQKYGEVYDSAHNEYLNYLICEGLLGLLSYLGAFISAIVLSVKVMKKNQLILCSIMPVIAYMVQAVVNIAIPITTPIFFALMYVSVAFYIENRVKDEKNINVKM